MTDRVNILFVSFSDNLSQTVKKILEKSEFKIDPHVVVTDTTILDFKVRNRFSYRKCSLGVFHDADVYGDIPLDSTILGSLKESESVCLKMMDRFDDTNGLISYQKRINLYHLLVTYWYNYILKNDIKACIFTSVPHVVSDYVLYSICKLLGVKTLMFYRTNVVLNKNVSLYPLENIDDGISGVVDTYNSIDLNSEIPLDERFLAYLDIRDNTNNTFTGVKGLSVKRFAIKRIVSSLRYRINNKIHWHRHGRTFTDTFVSKIIRKKYLSDDTGFDFANSLSQLEGKKFVYLPLHFQPECSSCPLGGDYAHQDLLINLLLSKLPSDWLVVVKKHVRKGGKDYTFNRLRKNSRVVIADNRIRSLDLVKSSSAIATITGTAGFEGFLNHKPVLMFGSYFYMDAPNVFKISDADSMGKAIEVITNSFQPTSLQQVKAFLYACQLHTSRAWVDNRYRSHCNISDEQNSDVLSNLIFERLNKWDIFSEK